MRSPSDVSDIAEPGLQREYAEVQTAIAVVRSGAARRVSLAGLRFGEAIVERLGSNGPDRYTSDPDVSVELARDPGGEVYDILVQRNPD
ncbi:MAG: hypothetical protein ACYDCI_14315 [Candidatus Limnocylindrales bacterium]